MENEYRVTQAPMYEGETRKPACDVTNNILTSTMSLLDQRDKITTISKPSDSRTAISANAQVLSGPGKLKGFWIVSHTAGATVRFSDALTATTPYVSSAWTSVVGHLAGTYIMIAQDGIDMVTGCYCTIAGTIEIVPDAELNLV